MTLLRRAGIMSTARASSSLSRYPKWVLVATGFAAAYGTYLIWSSWPSPDSSANLQRRNAVHRTRHTRDATVFRSSLPRAPTHPFGVLAIDHNGNTFTYAVGPEPPSAVAIQRALDTSQSRAEDIARGAQEIALRCIFQILLLPESENTSIASSDLFRDLQPLLVPLHQRDLDPLLASYIPLLCSGRWRYDGASVARAFAEHCGFGRFPTNSDHVVPMNSDHVVPMNLDHVDLALTETTVDTDRDEDREPAQGIKGLLYNIAEEQAKRQAYIHRGTRCDSCGELPIRGIRWHCINCPDYDLCSTCEAQNVHPRTHVFTKIKIPIATLAQPHQVQDLWYPGDPQRHWPLLKVPLRKRLVAETGFEDVQIEAFYDQFSCIANVALPDDAMEINAAIDRRAFNKAIMSPQWRKPLEPNFLFDRMFNFYDTDNNGVIDFGEFVSGLASLRMPDKRVSLERVFRGYDVDGDGFVSRRDFIRMLSAKYAVQKHIVSEIVQTEEAELVRHTADVVRSSQPISAAFTQEDVPPGETRRPGMKSVDEFGENQIRVGGAFGQPILPNGEEPPNPDFFGAVTARYGINPWPEQMNRDGLVTMEDALNVRNRYTKAESVPIEGSETEGQQRFLVETDSRRTRGQPDLQQPEERWKQDILDASRQTSDLVDQPEDQETRDHLELPDYILERGRAYEVPAAEKDFGGEVLFQVVQEGINELLDPLFESKEKMALAVRRTREERRRFREEIDAHVREKKAFQKELKTGAEIDPLLATANSAYSENRNASDVDRQRRDRSATVSPPELGDENHRVEVILRDGTDRPSEQDIAREIHEQIAQQNELLPADDADLEEMETTIREQPLENLLASAGYSVASPAAERHEVNTFREAEARTSAGPISTTTLQEEFAPVESINEGDGNSAEVERANWDPTLPQHRPNTASALPTSPTSPVLGDAMRLSPSSPPTPPPVSVQTPDLPFSSSSSVEAQYAESFADEPPSKGRLEELALLDEEEKKILERGGPGRLSLEELEELVRRDKDEGRGVLSGLVTSWLELGAGF